MKKRFVLGLLVFLILLLIVQITLAAGNITAKEKVAPTENDCIYYFYGDGCETCPQVGTLLEQLQNKYPQLQIQKFEVYYNSENLKSLQNYFNLYSVPKDNQGIPVIFMQNSYFLGHESILALLEERVKDNVEAGCPSLDKTEMIGLVGKSSSKRVLDNLHFWTVTGSALSSAFTPGTLALFLVLLMIFMYVKERQEMLRKGLLYLLGVFASYLLFGMGLFAWFGYSGIGKVFAKFMAIIALIAALAVIKDFFIPWKHTLKQVRPKIKAIFHKIMGVLFSYYMILIAGFVFGLLSFTNLNKNFLLIRFLYMSEATRTIALPLLLYYLILWVWLLIGALILAYLLKEYKHKKALNKPPFLHKNAEKWYGHYHKVFNFTLSLILVIFGLIVLFM
ncbi:MAG TPA: hypothetical protein VJA23_04830 [Candidatus Nanoarchaeia archaeon]|nr:hypothetical protein [Candidatus Nanoarchaeia archaeon]